MIRNSIYLSLLFSFLLIASCELYPQDDYEEQVFVETYLIGNEPLPEIRVSATAPFDAAYTFEAFALETAEILVKRLDDSGNVAEQFSYRLKSAGIYEPDTDDEHLVKPRATYTLDIQFPDRDDHLKAKTVIPDTFRVVRSVRDTAVYQSQDRIAFDYSLSSYPGRQNIYIFSTMALEPDDYPRTPFWADVEDGADKVRSNLINQDNYVINEDNTITLSFPWIGVAYYGPNKITAYAVDDNVYDYFRSVDVQLGGSTLAPGEIQNVFYNIDGGIGLFGSISGASAEVFIEQPPFP